MLNTPLPTVLRIDGHTIKYRSERLQWQVSSAIGMAEDGDGLLYTSDIRSKEQVDRQPSGETSENGRSDVATVFRQTYSQKG